MSFSIPTFGYITLTESVNKMIRPKRFLTNLLFGRSKEHATTKVQVDIVVGKRRIAPFVRRGKEAVHIGDLGQQTQIFEPPNIRMKKDLDAEQLLFTRGAGMPIYVPGGSGDMIQQGRMKKIAEEQADLRDMVDRTIEYLCAKALTGSYSITGSDGVFAIDFSMPAANKPVLAGTAKWDQADTATPLANIRAWKLAARKASGKIPTVAIMTTGTWEKFLKTAEVKTYLDKLNIDLGKIITPVELLDMGATKVAEIENVTYYTYDEYFTNSSGDLESMVPDGKVMLASPSADHRLHYAAIEDLKSGTVMGKYFSKDWITEDPSVYWLLVETHPLPVTHEPEANIYASVY
jgi:hypothetical protein